MSLISPNLMLSRSFFPNFGQGPFPKLAGKGPDKNSVKISTVVVYACISMCTYFIIGLIPVNVGYSYLFCFHVY